VNIVQRPPTQPHHVSGGGAASAGTRASDRRAPDLGDNGHAHEERLQASRVAAVGPRVQPYVDLRVNREKLGLRFLRDELNPIAGDAGLAQVL
jgi:hypothetical protein